VTHLFSANLISETRLGFTKAFLARESDGDRTSTNYAAQLGLKNLAASPGDYTLPNINLTGYAPGFPAASGGFVGYGTHIVQNNIYYRLGETITWIRDRHSVKFGGDVSRLMVGYDQGSNQNGVFNFSGNFTGDPVADFLLGYAQSANGGLGSLGNFGGVAKYSIGTQYQAYVQDDWKVNDRFTLNLGLRYEAFQPWRGRLANFDLATGRQLLAGSADYFIPGVGLIQQSGPALLPERPIRGDYNNFAPRLGAAYRLGEKTTIRSGAGIFYALNTGGSVLGPMTSTAPFFINTALSSSNTVPQLFLSQLFPTADKVPASVNTNVDLGKRDGYIYEYNFTVQHELRPTLLIEAGYIGNTAQKQIAPVWVNQPRLPLDPLNPTPFAAREPYPNLSPTFQQITNYEWSNYNAGYIKVEKRFSAGLSMTAAYTHSRFIDSGGGAPGQNQYNRKLERATADTDVPDNFIASYVYDLPLGRGRALNLSNPILNGALGGWQLSGITNFRSGMPLNITTANDLANVGTSGQRPNATGVPQRRLDPRTNGLLAFATNPYATPAKGTFGNLGRNTLRGFGINDWDVGIHKNFAIPRFGEQSRLQVRGEFFNFFNHTQFLGVATTQNVSSTFGIVNSTLDPRILQIAAKLYF
ncbi:MAG: TonB-dependent receptor, partial [Acidobacteriota bacterium]|nr:TonB-dependent receptor [Acidobacteriota bacterium]